MNMGMGIHKSRGKKMRPVWFWLVGWVLAAAWNVSAEPYFAMRTGFKCSQCHVNRTGGGKRTEYGVIYSQYQLLMKSAQSQKQAYSFDPNLSNSVSVGANFRVEPTFTQAYTTKPVNVGDSAQTYSSDFVSAPVKESNFYFQVDLVKDFLTFYYDQGALSGAMREMWGMVQSPFWNSYAKAGKMLLPYGIRLMDDEAFVRKYTGYTYNTTGMSYEVGIEPGPLSLIVNANDNLISSVGSVIFSEMPIALRTFRLGGSYSLPVKVKERRAKNTSMGVFGGFAMGMFTVFGERDLIQKKGVNMIADYAEVDCLPMRGLNFKGVFEWMTPDKRAQEHNGRRRITVGVEPYPVQFVQLGLYYRINDFEPQVGGDNQDQIVGRVQVYF